MAARRNKSHEPVAPAPQLTAPDAPTHASAPADVQHTLAENPAPPAAEAEGGQRSQWQPDPFPLMAISLGPDKDSPKMKLFRSNRLNQMAILFEEKPDSEHRARLRETGWKWREDEGVWTKQLDRERRASSQLEAERLFTGIGDAIRSERGLSGRTGVGE